VFDVPLPPRITRMSRNGVVFTSDVNRAQYTLQELTRAALRDIGQIMNYTTHREVKKIAGGSLRKTKRPRKAFQYWIRKRETDLIVGIRHNTWYGVDQELGTKGQPKREILRKSLIANVNYMVQIQAKYLKHMENQSEAIRHINENDEGEDQGDENG
jgi:hypothetical protein